MSDPFIGEIRPWACNFAPRGWAMCQGQTMQIAQNSALFALIGITYGGNGQTNFCLPNLMNKIPIHMGNGNGLTPRQIGSTGGTTQEALSIAQMPPHNHLINAVDSISSVSTPADNVFSKVSYKSGRDSLYPNSYIESLQNTSSSLNTAALTPTGSSTPHDNRQPFLTLNYCIALMGIWPSRP